MSSVDVTPTRRSLLRGAAVAGGTGSAVALGWPAAEAAALPAGRKHRHRHKNKHKNKKRRRMLKRRGRHLVGRFSYGVTPKLARQVRKQGGAEKWFERQLAPARIHDSAAARIEHWWPSFARSPQDLWKRSTGEIEGGWEVMFDYQRWLILRRMHSKRQVLEVMTEFWENHLHVPANGDPSFTHRVRYGKLIRSHALGRFDEMLNAAITHPAMLIYLNAAVSTARNPNENLGRELLELHTVGRGHYGEDDVKASARILTGWSVDMWKTFAPSYRSRDHATGRVRVMDFSDANASADGRAVTRRYLDHLAHHPATAQHLARKLATKFVQDDPPQWLVDRLAKVYLAHGTEIKPVLRALVASSAFRSAVGKKVRDPGEDVVATYRALGIRIHRPGSGDGGDRSAVSNIVWQAGNLGMMPMTWPQPNGQPLDNASWASPSRLLASMDLHWSMSGGWWPTQGITYRRPVDWLPKKSVHFEALVEHLSRSILHRHATPALLKACCQATGEGPRARITADSPLVKWNFPRLLTTLLDSPAHLTR